MGRLELEGARLTEAGQAAIAGIGQPELSEAGRLLELPGEGMFASAAPDEQDITGFGACGWFLVSHGLVVES